MTRCLNSCPWEHLSLGGIRKGGKMAERQRCWECLGLWPQVACSFRDPADTLRVPTVGRGRDSFASSGICCVISTPFPVFSLPFPSRAPFLSMPPSTQTPTWGSAPTVRSAREQKQLSPANSLRLWMSVFFIFLKASMNRHKAVKPSEANTKETAGFLRGKKHSIHKTLENLIVKR